MRKWLQAGILLVYCILVICYVYANMDRGEWFEGFVACTLIYMVQRAVLWIAAKVGGAGA